MRLKILFLSIFLNILCFTPVHADTINIGMVLDGPSIIADDIIALVKKEIHTLTAGEFDVQFPDSKTILSDWTLEGNKQAVDKLLNDRSVDIVLTLGVISTSHVVKLGDLKKPVIATLVLDAKVQKTPLKDNASGVKNLSYIAIASDFEENIEEGKKRVNARHITVLTNKTIDIAIPNLNRRLKQNLVDLGAKVELIALNDSIEQTLNQINPKTDIVIVAHQTFLSFEEKMQIINGLIDRKLPSFSMAGSSEVEMGFLMSSGQDDIDIKRLGRRIALNLQNILLGEKPSELPVFFKTKKQVTLNMETAKKIGFSPNFELLEKAVLINADYKQADTLTIFDAVDRAVTANLNLSAKDKQVRAGAQEVKKAWANLLPQVGLSNTYTDIDEDRAVAALGGAPQRTSAATLTINQILFSEDAFSNIDIQKYSQQALEDELEELELDIVNSTTKAYLNVLRTDRIRKIQINNLELSRSNLELAKTRKNIGESSAADIYRWQSEIANNQQEILSADRNYANALLTLNRLMHERLEQDYVFADINLVDDRKIFIGDITSYIENPFGFQLLRDFMVNEGLAAAPEIQQIENLLNVKKRIHKNSRRSFFTPEISAQVSVKDNYYEEGSGISSTISSKNDRDFTAVIQASYPLFEGGERIANLKQSHLEVNQFELQLEAIKEQVAEEIRSSLQNVGSSHASIKWSNQSAQAAAKNLELVQTSYKQGAQDITVLLDAQNAALNADQVATNAVYDFLLDYFDFQRAIRTFYFRNTDKNKQIIMDRFSAYFRSNGIDPTNR